MKENKLVTKEAPLGKRQKGFGLIWGKEKSAKKG